MITLRMKAEVRDDRRVFLTLRPEVPTGPAELVVTVESANETGSQPRGVPAAAVIDEKYVSFGTPTHPLK